jgi:hypothetical protein
MLLRLLLIFFFKRKEEGFGESRRIILVHLERLLPKLGVIRVVIKPTLGSVTFALLFACIRQCQKSLDNC